MKTPNVTVPRTGGHNFAQVPRADIPRSAFDMSHGLKTTFDAGLLIPILVEDILPGDTFNVKMNGLARIFSPLKAPIMDNLYLETFFFFVPNRLTWSNWQKFCGEQTDPGDNTDFTVPRIADGKTVGASGGDLYNYMFIPIGLQTTPVHVSALPFRALNLIYNEWFRDQNLIDSVVNNTDDGPDTSSDYGVYSRGKRHDYFTSALPWPVKTDDGTEITTQFPISGLGKISSTYGAGSTNVYETGNVGTTNYPANTSAKIDGGGGANEEFFIRQDANNVLNPGLFADITINQLRQAIQIQRLRERDARGGTRYVEIIKSHFGVTSPDARLQRPEYLGGGRSMVNITPIAQTGQTATTPQGTLTSVGTSAFSGHGFAKSFVEHGYLIGLACVRADLTYQQGLRRHYSRATRFDFFWPALSGLGEQAILNKEIWISNVAATDDGVFGYIPRWDEYRHGMSEITGKFRSDATGSLDLWHLAQDFAALPALNETFINESVPMSRVQAVTTEPDFILDAWFTVKAARPLPTFGVPGMMDHF